MCPDKPMLVNGYLVQPTASPPSVSFYQRQDKDGKVHTYVIRKEKIEDIKISYGASNRMQTGTRIIVMGENAFLIMTHNCNESEPFISGFILSITDLADNDNAENFEFDYDEETKPVFLS